MPFGQGSHWTSLQKFFFLIENVFFDDMRHKNAERISQPIIDWYRQNPGLPCVRQKNMNEVRFYDLNIRVGSYYLYVHQGDCEHTFIVTNVRMIHRSDPLNTYAYPFVTYQQLPKRQKCNICETYNAKFVSYDDKYTTESPFYFCKNCFISFHFDTNGKLLYNDFTAFEYDHH
ncbi:hypothetical protein RFI_01993 [Reticulomyxa filosa]|uniref:snRNA-activating protein complex subunit 3 n=1 Tax=Reticulomyxa filosa TaxID=46433 RepID=X6PA82_RETFI|nr:hypothetical protein RFI_01993 [Reticulomyxa filosa]|eukprot:ETO35081.1 hypothetical protein RFI_01993 [Reticulomyxa filosa]